MLQLAPYAGQRPEDCWRAREATRFNSGEYLPIGAFPWASADWYRNSPEGKGHFAHVSIEDPSKIAFTPNERFGREDRQLRMKPGKYLRKYFGKILAETEITEFARSYAALNEKVELQLAETADEIVRVYTDGPRSCMSSSDSVRMYAGHGLAVAYVAGKDGDPTGRAVCWPEKLVFSRIYGDDSRLRASLMRAGYHPQGPDHSFVGAQLTLEAADGEGYVCPWLDFNCSQVDADRGSETLRVTRGGEYDAQQISGVIGGIFCERCESHGNSDDCFSVNDQNWCVSCYESYGFHCESCEESYDTDDARTVEGDPNSRHANHEQIWCTACARDQATECDECEKLFAGGTVEVGNSTYCSDCADEKTFHCESCEETCAIDDGSVTVLPRGETQYDQNWCNSCAKDTAIECDDCRILFVPEGDETNCFEHIPAGDCDA